jgi:hypothetical protein
MQRGSGDVGLIQVIEFKTKRPDDIAALTGEWRS